MARDDDRSEAEEVEQVEETQSLLAQASNDGDIVVPSPSTSTKPRSPIPFPPRRQSSFAQPRPAGEPRTPNRVRFDDDTQVLPPNGQNGHADPRWVADEDYMLGRRDSDDGRRDSDTQRLPLLTDIEAPSVTVASADVGFNAEDLLESARPKSGMRSAFMNMANSIM